MPASPQLGALTARQRQFLAVMACYTNEHGYPPTIRELGERLQIGSPNGVVSHLRVLERKGYVEHRAQSWRAWYIRPQKPRPASPPSSVIGLVLADGSIQWTSNAAAPDAA